MHSVSMPPPGPLQSAEVELLVAVSQTGNQCAERVDFIPMSVTEMFVPI